MAVKKTKKTRLAEETGSSARSMAKKAKELKGPGKKKPRDPERTKTRIKKKKEEINIDLKDLKVPDHTTPTEKKFLEEYMEMLDMTSRFIRRLDKQMTKKLSSRDLYALSTIMSQHREIIADIRTVSDMGQQVQMTVEQVLQPFAKTVGQSILDSFYHLRRLTMEVSKPKETQFALKRLDEITKEQGTAVQSAYEEAERKINELLLSTPVEAKHKRKKRKL